MELSCWEMLVKPTWDEGDDETAVAEFLKLLEVEEIADAAGQIKGACEGS